MFKSGSEFESPIDIPMSSVVFQNVPALQFCGVFDETCYTTIYNDGESGVSFELSSGTASIFGGPLNYEYFFKKAQFRWGSRDDYGSEHAIDGKKFPLEVQMFFASRPQRVDSVHHSVDEDEGKDEESGTLKQSGDSPGTSLDVSDRFESLSTEESEGADDSNTQCDSLSKVNWAVVSVLFDNNLQLNRKIVSYNSLTYLTHVRQPDQKIIVNANLLRDFIYGVGHFNYYFYTGTLNIEPLEPGTIFIIFCRPLPLLSMQLAELRNIMSNSGRMEECYTSLKELKGRKVKYAVFDEGFTCPPPIVEDSCGDEEEEDLLARCGKCEICREGSVCTICTLESREKTPGEEEEAAKAAD